MTLREGKNREVRRALDTLGLKVNRLIRISYGPFQLGGISKGDVEEIKQRVLRQQVGHLVEIPEYVPKPKGQRMGKPARGTHASAKRFAKETKAAPTGRGKFAHKTKGKSQGKPQGKPRSPSQGRRK